MVCDKRKCIVHTTMCRYHSFVALLRQVYKYKKLCDFERLLFSDPADCISEYELSVKVFNDESRIAR